MNRQMFLMIVLVLAIALNGCSTPPKTAKLGETLALPGIGFRIDSTSTFDYITHAEGGTLGDVKIHPKDTSEVFFGLDLTIINRQDSSISVERGPVLLLDANGKECSRIDNPHDAMVGARDSTRVSHTFQIKRSAVVGATVSVHDPFSNQSGVIYLVNR